MSRTYEGLKRRGATTDSFSEDDESKYVISVQSSRVSDAGRCTSGVTEYPTQDWTMQQMREAFPGMKRRDMCCAIEIAEPAFRVQIETKRICRYAFLINNLWKATGKTLGHLGRDKI